MPQLSFTGTKEELLAYLSVEVEFAENGRWGKYNEEWDEYEN